MAQRNRFKVLRVLMGNLICDYCHLKKAIKTRMARAEASQTNGCQRNLRHGTIGCAVGKRSMAGRSSVVFPEARAGNLVRGTSFLVCRDAEGRPGGHSGILVAY